MTTRRILRWLILAGALYGSFAVLARMLASRALYHPAMASGRAPEGAQRLRAPEGSDVTVLHLPKAGAHFTVWFFHGNAEDLGDLEPSLLALRDAGFAVFASEYPGYGGTGGRPTEEGIYAAARVAREHLRGPLGVPAERTILYGRSLGGGPAVQLATEERLGGLVLHSAFTSVYRVVTQWRILPADLFENERKMARVTCPVLVMHGREDEVIPWSHGVALLAAAPGQKRSLWVPGAGHNDLIGVAGQEYWRAWREFSELCAQVSGRKP
jgi:fermentation-respiration switch protein FrsA (DUF1100 family)